MKMGLLSAILADYSFEDMIALQLIRVFPV